jgi:hypothetical protein
VEISAVVAQEHPHAQGSGRILPVGTGALSAIILTLIMVMIVAQVLSRALDKLLALLGFSPLGLNVQGLAELAAFIG